MKNSIVIALIAVITAITIIPPVQAGAFTTAKMTISDSRSGQSGTSHIFSFVTGTTGAIKTVEMLYCTTPTGTCTTPNGLVTTSATQGSLTGLSTSTTNASVNGTITLTVTTPVSINSGTTLEIPYTLITNPTTINSSFFVRVTSKDNSNATIDTIIVAFATLTSTSVAITADVGATFSVILAAVNSGSVNGQAINISSSTASTIPYGILSSGSSKIAAHEITVVTNSSGGYITTVRAADPPLTDGSNNIDTFIGTDSIPTTWTSPAGNTPNVNTGFLGYTTEDTSLCSGTANRYNGNKWAGFSTTAYEVACSAGAVLSGETTRIGWQVEVNGFQPAGSYSGNIIIVTTPTY